MSGYRKAECQKRGILDRILNGRVPPGAERTEHRIQKGRVPGAERDRGPDTEGQSAGSREGQRAGYRRAEYWEQRGQSTGYRSQSPEWWREVGGRGVSAGAELLIAIAVRWCH